MLFQLRHVNSRSCASAFLLLLIASMPALSQEPRASVRVEVRTDAGPVEGAAVLFNGAKLRTDENGIVSGSTALGEVKITVIATGFDKRQDLANAAAASSGIGSRVSTPAPDLEIPAFLRRAQK